MSHIMNANNKLCDFKQWCQLVLPLVYDDTLSYYEVLDKVVVYLNKTTKSVKAIYPILDEIIKELSDMQEILDNLDSIVDETVSEYLNSPEFLNRLRTLTLQWIDESLVPIRETLATKANISDIPTKTSELINDSGFITDAVVPTKTSELTNDSNFVSDANYVHTDNNFSNSDKSKLDGIETGAEINVQSDWNVSDSTSDAFIKNKPTIPTKTSDLVNDSGFITDADVPVIDDTETTSNNVWSALKTSSELAGKVSDSNYVHTDNNFTNADKTKLNGIASGAEVNVQSNWTQTDNTADDFIKNKPTIPTKTSQLTNDSSFLVNNANSNYVGKWNGWVNDFSTNNTTDTWIPVMSGSKVQHRVLNAALNTYIEASGTNCISANNCNIQYLKCIRIGKVVTCTFFFTHNSAQTGTVAYVALKSEFRPAQRIFFPVNIIGNANAYANESAHRMYLYPDGTMALLIDNTNANVSQCMGSVSYCIS